MCSADQHSTRTRKILPCDGDKRRPKERLPQTVSTSAPTSDGGGDGSIPTPPRPSHLRDMQRRICPVTGLFRDIRQDYRIRPAIIGRGHYGCVRECERRGTGRVLAVKSVDKSKINRLDHLKREVYLLYNADHRNVMSMVDCYEDDKYVHIVTPKYAGGELFERITESTTPYGCFPERRAAGIVRSLLEAVKYLHEHDTVHRDIKPENILFESPSEDSAIRLIDFGLSRRHRRGEAPMTNPVGTAYYMAPEVLEGSYDRSCDVWSVGTVAYILLSGYPPFNGSDDREIFERIRTREYDFPSAAWSDKSREAKDFVRCLLRTDPGARPTAAEALNHDWLKVNACDDKKREANRHDDLRTRVQMLRSTISKFRSVVAQQR